MLHKVFDTAFLTKHCELLFHTVSTNLALWFSNNVYSQMWSCHYPVYKQSNALTLVEFSLRRKVVENK